MSLENTIEYNNDKYRIMIKLVRTSLVSAITEVNPEDTVNLPMNNVSKLEIVSDIVNPVLTATIEFTDGQESYMSGYLSSTSNYAIIGIKKIDQASQSTESGVDAYEWTFTHTFLIAIK